MPIVHIEFATGLMSDPLSMKELAAMHGNAACITATFFLEVLAVGGSSGLFIRERYRRAGLSSWVLTQSTDRRAAGILRPYKTRAPGWAETPRRRGTWLELQYSDLGGERVRSS